MPNKLTMICYFWEGFKPFIKVKMEQQDWESVNFEEIVQRAINAEAKAGLKSTIMVQDSDICCPWGHRLFNNTASKMQTQGIIANNFSRLEEFKTKDPKSVPPCDNPVEPAKKENKQKKFKRQREHTSEPKETPTIGDNTVNAAKKKKSVILIRSRVSTAIKKATMPAIASSQKTSVSLGNFCIGDWWWWRNC